MPRFSDRARASAAGGRTRCTMKWELKPYPGDTYEVVPSDMNYKQDVFITRARNGGWTIGHWQNSWTDEPHLRKLGLTFNQYHISVQTFTLHDALQLAKVAIQIVRSDGNLATVLQIIKNAGRTPA